MPASLPPDHSQTLRVWLDDVRPMPAGWDRHVYTAHEAIALLKTGQVVAISLDHDLGDESVTGTGYTVACWIEAAACLGQLKAFDVFIHSANPVGSSRMHAAITVARRAWEGRDDQS